MDGLHTERREEIATHADGADAFRIAAAGQVDTLRAQRRELLERRIAGDEVRHVGGRRRKAVEADPLLHLGAELPRHHQSIRVGERQWPQSTASTTLKIAALAPIPRARVMSAMSGEPGPERQGAQGGPDVVHVC